GRAIRTGEVWEISIPKLSQTESFSSYTVKLSVPSSFGQLAYVSPEADRVEGDGKKIYVFDKNTISKTGVTAAFGQFQVFEFDLTYHLENPLGKAAIAEIAIPPDTAYQKVTYSSLTPEPQTVTIDNDGNWIAIYKLKPRERIDVKAQGVVQIFAGPRYQSEITNEAKLTNLKESAVWQINSPIVRASAKDLNTPRQIYDYIVSTLSYDYDRVRPNVDRLGAEEVLRNPKNAICMEFTDAFIALARSKGIPAREVNGYAYTENPELQPLSLVADVLHSWPEFWDDNRKVWIPVDPTWGNTTGGVDYFSKLDLRHFTFVIHGSDPYKPYPPGSYKLGASPQKDVYVNFGKLPEKRLGAPLIKAKIQPIIPLISDKLIATVRNPGPTSIENQSIDVYFDSRKVLEKKIEILPPYSETTVEQKIPFALFGHNTPSKIEVSYDGQSTTLPTDKSTVIIISLVIVLILIFALVLYLFLRTKFKKDRPSLTKLYERIGKLLGRKEPFKKSS
ncbi:transglutaminase domain-containing protein, partial [Candidatus Microgenomates bacterium]|nr:transglutaminase domain-containing protein [Candidatus Microgenomates bacterium]